MVLAVGSMMVKGVFKAGGLLTGLGSMVGKLKGAQQEGKSTSTEMKRMTGHAHLLRNALAMIGVGGFSALLMQTPALAGGLVKIKNEMMLIAYAVGRHLKPSLDAVATILQGIRTGDWSKIKAGVLDLGVALADLAIKAASIVIDLVWGEGTAAKALEEFNEWAKELKLAWDEGDFGKFLVTLVIAPTKWVWDTLIEFFGNLRNEVDRIIRETARSVVTEGVGETLRQMPIVGKLMQFGGYDRAFQQKQEKLFEHGLSGETRGGLWEREQQNIFGETGKMKGGIWEPEQSFDDHEKLKGEPPGKSGFMWDQNISMMDAWKRNIKGESNIGKQDVSMNQGGIPDFEPRQSFDDHEKLKGGIWDRESTTIDTQTNTFNIDVSGVVGDFEDPIVQNKIYDIVTKALRDNQQKVTY